MKYRPRLPRVLLLLSFVLAQAGSGAHAQDDVSILVFSKTDGFRHESIPAALSAIEELGEERGWIVEATENASDFNEANLDRFDAVIFLMTVGDVLSTAQENAFEQFIEGGGGFVGIHSASDTEYGWPWYGGLVGAYFSRHPAPTTAVVKVADRHHPSTDGLPARWSRFDEWYDFSANPRGRVHVLATLDESTYAGGQMGFDHPIAWCHPYAGGRSWYTAGGHASEAYADDAFRSHLAGGIEYAAGKVPGDCTATITDIVGGAGSGAYSKVVLEPDMAQPMALRVAGDGRVFFIERAGRLRIYLPEDDRTVLAGAVPVSFVNEDGLLGLELDPEFDSNGYLYLYYSPPSVVANRVSRFHMNGNVLDLSSERVLLDVPTQRQTCCHSGGDLDFDAAGNLYLSTGDNTSPFGDPTSGFAPLDERESFQNYDSQRTSGNTNDLRGKVLRITPVLSSTDAYTIPAGNLFPDDGSEGRPEIFAMGFRNPFRITVDRETGLLYVGDVGPDATVGSPSRGPAGHDELNRTFTAANFGWPYCIANNLPYVDFDYEDRVSGSAFDCEAPRNQSPNNTGAVTLPPARPAWLWYTNEQSRQFRELGSGSRTMMAGAVYHYDARTRSDEGLPEYFDDTLFLIEWSRYWIQEVKLDDEGELLEINPFLGHATGIPLRRPIDLQFGPDGVMYVLEWGSGFQQDNPDAQLVKIVYSQLSVGPIVQVQATPQSGPSPLTVQFRSTGTYHPAGAALAFAWDFDGDGETDSTVANPTYTYERAGSYEATLVVRDLNGNTASASVTINAGNSPPVVTFELPPNGGFAAWGEYVQYRVHVEDYEDGTTEDCDVCARVVVRGVLGHAGHTHVLSETNGCEGWIRTSNAEHEGESNLSFVLEASYTDEGSGELAPITTTTSMTLRNGRVEAESFSTQSGITTGTTQDVSGGQDVTELTHRDYIELERVNLHGINEIEYRVSSSQDGNRIEVHLGSRDGRLASTASIPNTGGSDRYANVRVPITDTGQTEDLYMVFLYQPGSETRMRLNWMQFVGPGVSVLEPNGASRCLATDGGVGIDGGTHEAGGGGCGCRITPAPRRVETTAYAATLALVLLWAVRLQRRGRKSRISPRG